MDTFRFLKYWKTNGAAFTVNCGSNIRTANTITSAILAAATHHPSSADANGIEDDDDEFFKFTEPIDLFLNASEPNEKSSRASAVKTAAVFRVLSSRLKKSKANGAEEKTESNGSVSTTANQKQRKLNPIQRSSSVSISELGPNETRFSKDLVQKYLKGVKPMYIRVSKRYTEKKLRLKSPRNLRSGQSQPSSKPNSTSSMAVKRENGGRKTTESQLPVILKTWKQGNFPARMPKKNLGKRRSASPGLTREKRRDDSVLEKEDGIRSAILHCKRSFNGSRDSESSILSGSVSDDKSLNSSENCSEEPREGGNGGDGSEVEIR